MRRGTYSIVARDPDSGELGVAVQSHWFSVGPIVPWAEAGVAAVATQSVVDLAYGPRALALVRAGVPAAAALSALVAADPHAAVRQVAVVDGDGRVGAHTGPRCISEAGHVAGEGFCCQANMMARATVPAAMAEGYVAGRGDLAARLVAALEGAEAEGGDVRGRQSAALLVVPAEGESWRRSIELRVEDHPDPVAELGRLLVLQRAYDLAGQADDLVGEGRPEAAGPLYERAAGLAPNNAELAFWAGLARAQAGDLEGGAAAVGRVIERHAGWGQLLDRLTLDIAPAAAAVRDALGR